MNHSDIVGEMGGCFPPAVKQDLKVDHKRAIASKLTARRVGTGIQRNTDWGEWYQEGRRNEFRRGKLFDWLRIGNFRVFWRRKNWSL